MAALVAPYTYPGKIVRCRDVDTVVVDVDRGEGNWTLGRVFRLHGCNGIEAKAPGGAWCAEQLEQVMPAGRRVLVTSLKPGRDIDPDRYGGRWVARIVTEGGDLTDLLIKAGLAVKWDGRGGKPVPVWPIPAGVPTLASLLDA